MPNPPNTTPRPAALLLVIAAVAAGAYLLLLSGWRDPPAAADEPAAAPAGQTTQLELSRRLSPPGLGNPPAAEPSVQRRGWLTPLIAFSLPLALGFIWGAWSNRARPGTLDEIGNVDADDDLATGGGVTAAPPSAVMDAPPSAEPVAPEQVAPGEPKAPGPPPPNASGEQDEDAEWPDLTTGELHERLRAKNDVIEALEAIVRENQDEWEARERRASDQQYRIAELEAELDAVSHVVEERPAAASSESPAASRPEVLSRRDAEARAAGQSVQ